MKQNLCWAGMLISFWAGIAWLPEVFGWRLMDGFVGLVIRFFLGYCAIVLAAQLFSALAALRCLAEASAKRKKVSQQVLFRTEQPSMAPEE